MVDGKETADRATVCLAASPGGHMALLRAVRGAVEEVDRVWITAASGQADTLRAEGEDVRTLPPWARDSRGLAGARENLLGSWRIAREVRPALVITSGAGHVVPFALAARALGARIVFVETMARVGDASLTGRLLAPLSSVVLVQWPESAAVYRQAVVCRPALLERRPPARAAEGQGTFVSVGTRPEPFDRLLAAVDRAVVRGTLPAPVTAQAGASRYRPASYPATPWLEPAEVERAIARSRYVVCHAGSAILSQAITAGRRPLVMPRLPERGEHRTDHQRQVLAKLVGRGLVVPLGDDVSDADVHAADAPPGNLRADDPLPSVESILRAQVDAAA